MQYLKRILLASLTLCLLCSFSAGLIGAGTLPPIWAASQEWLRYVNARFGYSVGYPDLFSRHQQSENGDGVCLESEDGKIRLAISGGHNILMQDGRDMLKAREAKGVLKKESGRGWFRLIRREKGQIVHEYGIVNDDIWASFTFTYPKTKDFEAVIDRMEQTLRLGGKG